MGGGGQHVGGPATLLLLHPAFIAGDGLLSLMVLPALARFFFKPACCCSFIFIFSSSYDSVSAPDTSDRSGAGLGYVGLGVRTPVGSLQCVMIWLVSAVNRETLRRGPPYTTHTRR